MNQLQTFNFNNQPVRTVQLNNQPYWVLKDVCEVLELSNPTVVANRLEDDEVTKFNLGGLSGETNIITESGLYAVILRSDKPNAKEFRKWVTSEVLPAIRKNGVYLTDQKAAAIITNKDSLAELLLQAGQQLKEKELLIEQMKPKALFADAVSQSNSTILVRDLAKVLHQNGIDIGQNKLYEWLRNNGYLIKSGKSKNTPTQRAMELGLFKIKEGSYINGIGANVLTITTLVTGKGQQYFINKFLSN